MSAQADLQKALELLSALCMSSLSLEKNLSAKSGKKREKSFTEVFLFSELLIVLLASPQEKLGW